MTRSVIKIEVRVYKSQVYRDANWEVSGDDVISDPADYGVSKVDYASTEAQIRWKIRGINPEILSFAKILGKPGQDEHYACYTTDPEIAIGWLFNP